MQVFVRHARKVGNVVARLVVDEFIIGGGAALEVQLALKLTLVLVLLQFGLKLLVIALFEIQD